MQPTHRFLYLHGGPGLNSFAERAILGPRFIAAGAEIHFWNEPSRLRAEGDPFSPIRAYEGWLDSARRALIACSATSPVCVIAHSFAAIGAIEIARLHADRVSALVLVASAANPLASYSNVLRIAQSDFAVDAPEMAARLAGCLARTRTIMDAAMREGFPLVVQDPQLFTHYYARPEALAASMRTLSEPEAQLDMEAFFAVMDDFAARWQASRTEAPCFVPALALFGGLDPITPQAEQVDDLRAELPHVIVQTFEDCGHFCHLDAPDPFVDRVLAWTIEASAGSEMKAHRRTSRPHSAVDGMGNA